ncbi:MULTISPECIES: class E sortase [Thermomonosporaceae]|uniref:class E sortase n=1 Tax=Thermomonosporaceae TaxID=2012 RepID=UPI00255ACFBA|nr:MULTISPECIES: class E sortase [Thermomonosporaceae]MDL4773206.1 class E sortase [Actinomadura xylanilytica]
MKPISLSSTALRAMAAGVAATTAWSLAVPGGADAVPARAETAAVAPGAGLGRLTIARMGLTSTVREGVAARVLTRGVGHYPGTALPGRTGNAVFLGHRTSAPAPFDAIDRLRKGDRVVFRSGSRSYVYRVYASRIIAPGDFSVLAPVPFERGVRPKRAVATLISCYPKGSSAHRIAVFATLKPPAGRGSGR